jgi:hypothetical protein
MMESDAAAMSVTTSELVRLARDTRLRGWQLSAKVWWHRELPDRPHLPGRFPRRL